MRAFWYTILFITPTVLVLIYRTQIQEYPLGDKGIIRRPPGKTAPGEPGTTPTTPTTVIKKDPAVAGQPKPIKPTPPPIDRGEEFDLEVNARYPMPEFKALATVVGNWHKVPANAFPEMVKLRKPVELSLIIAGKVSGKSQLKVGQTAYPISLEGSTLAISGSPGKRGTQGTIDIDDTDFKEQVEQKYTAWKARQTARVMKLRKEAKARLIAAKQPAATPSSPSTSSIGPEPTRSADGSVAVMVASIKAGHVKEIQLDKIEYWRWLGKDTVGGQEYWAGVVGYVANTIFGDINTEGKALIRHGKVVKWVYSGSEEAIK